jgi:hypothetical protein
MYFRLLTAGSIEEKIFQRQISKTGLSGAVVDPQNQSKIRLSNEELKVHDLLRGKKCYAEKIREEQDWSYLYQCFDISLALRLAQKLCILPSIIPRWLVIGITEWNLTSSFMEQGPSKKLIATQPVKKFLIFYAVQRFIIMFTRT